MKIDTVQLTPKRATEWLQLNAINRPLRNTWVQYLANEMKAGRWRDNGDTFDFDTDNQMVDGQHRCAAVKRSGVTITALVVRDLAPEARLTIDVNLRRRFSDDLAMNGISNAAALESILRKIVKWERDHGFGTRDQISRVLLADEYPKHAEAMREANAKAHHYSRVPANFGVRSFVWWLLRRTAPEETVQAFFSVLAIGSQNADDAVLVRLREKLTAHLLDTGRNAPVNESVYYMIRAWNSWLSGEPTRYALPRGGLKNPYPQPLPVGEARRND